MVLLDEFNFVPNVVCSNGCSVAALRWEAGEDAGLVAGGYLVWKVEEIVETLEEILATSAISMFAVGVGPVGALVGKTGIYVVVAVVPDDEPDAFEASAVSTDSVGMDEFDIMPAEVFVMF